MNWIIAYDVSSPARWRRIYRIVRDHGVRVQWSVFMTANPSFSPKAFMDRAAREIDVVSDDLRLYRLNALAAPAIRGRAILPSGIVAGIRAPGGRRADL